MLIALLSLVTLNLCIIALRLETVIDRLTEIKHEISAIRFHTRIWDSDF